MASPQSKVAFLPTVTPAEVELTYVVTIGGVNVTPMLATFRISETIDNPATLLADIVSTLAPHFRPTVGQSVFATEAGVRIFGGSVTGVRERGLTGPSEDIVVEVQASSFELNAARRVITATISADAPVTIGAAFGALVSGWYGALGVTLHPAQVAGPIVPAVSFARERGDTVNRQLAGSVGFLQSIDFENRLRAWAPGEIAAPVNYDEDINADLLTGDIEVERQLQNGYANRIVLSGDKAQTDDTDRWIGDGVTQLFPLSRTPVSWQVVQLNETNQYETVGTPPAMWIIDPAAKTIRREDSMGAPPAGTIIDFRYIGIFDPQAAAEDASEIATYGLWEFAETISSVSGGSAADYAAVLLARKIASKDEILTMRTRQPGFRAGQLMNVIAPSRGVAGDFLITQVETRSEAGGKRLVRAMTLARSQTNDHDWRRIYVQWAGGGIGESSGGGTVILPPVDPGAGSSIHGGTHHPEGTDPIPKAAFIHIPNAWAAEQRFPKVRAGGTGQGSKLLHVGSGNDPVVNGQDGITVQMQDVAAQISLRYANAAAPMEMGLIAFPGEARIGTWTNHPLKIRTNNLDALTIREDGLVAVIGTLTANLASFASNCYAATFLASQPTIYVGGFAVTVTANCSIPGAGGGGGDVYLAAANVFTQMNTFPLLTVGPGADASPMPATGIIVNRLGPAGIALRNSSDHVEIGMFAHAGAGYIRTHTLHDINFGIAGGTQMAIMTDQSVRMIGNCRVGSLSAPSAALHIGPGADAIVQGFGHQTVTLQASWGNGAQFSARIANGANGIEVGLMAHPNGNCYLGTWTNHDLRFRANNLDLGYFGTDQHFHVTNTIFSYGLQLTSPTFYVGGKAVTVTADCQIPGTGGGSTLPPNLAYTNVHQDWSASQTFNGGISVNGGFTVAGVDWNTWLNQPVRTDSSPTFAGLALGGVSISGDSGTNMVTFGGNIYSPNTIHAGTVFYCQNSAGLTVTRVLGGVSCQFKGGILVG